jgi:LPXTG-motif cell wall-anchored protein
VQIVPREHLALVLAGPERADTIWWWRLRAETGAEGWGNQDEMTPDPGPCAFGASVSAGGPTPPYPVTILPSFSFAQTPAPEQSLAQAAPLPQATPAQQETLPQTGGSGEWWFLAVLLAIIVVVVGVVRRRLQTQFIVNNGSPQDDETDTKKL